MDEYSGQGWRRIIVNAKSVSLWRNHSDVCPEAGYFVGFVFMSLAVKSSAQGPSRPGSQAGVQDATLPVPLGIPPQLSQLFEKAPIETSVATAIAFFNLLSDWIARCR
jgi:hypothetical protein